MNKRRWAALLAGALTLSLLAACGGKGNESTPDASSSEPEGPSVSVIAPVEPGPEPEPVYPYANPLTGEGLDVDIAQRIIDFTSGSCYAISGNLQKISHYIFIITPSSVDISGDFQDIFNDSFEMPINN